MDKLIGLINSLDRNELVECTDFLKSPYFNKRTDIIKFWEIVIESHPVKEFDREKIYKRVYGNEIYNSQVVTNLLSRTQNLVRKFLTQIGLNKDKISATSALSYELAARGLNKMLEKNIDNAISELENEYYTVEYLKKYYELTELRESLVVSFRNYKEKLANTYLRSESLVNYFILNLLRIANDLVVFKFVTSFKEDEEIFNGFFNFFDFRMYLGNLENIKSPYYAITAVFYYGLMSKLDDPVAEYREKLKKVVFENLDTMKYQDQTTCWTMLFAAFIFTNTPQKYDVSTEIHSINKMFVAKNILTKDELGYVMENNYHNIAVQAINAKDYQWAEKFLNEFKSKLPPGSGEDTFNACMARCCFEKGNYDGCLAFLAKMKIDNIMTRLNISTLYIRSYYELGYYEEAASAIESMRIFLLQNKQLTPQVKRTMSDFIKNARLVVKAKSLQKKLSEEHYLRAQRSAGHNSKSWILEKMKELI